MPGGLYEAFIEPWMYGEWMARAMLASVLAAVACGVLGCWLYVRRLSMMGDALSHVVVPGLAVAFMVTGSRDPGAMLLGAMIAGWIASVLIGALQRNAKVKEDAAMGVVFTALFALGVILITVVARRVHLDADCVLYGNVLGVADESVTLMMFVCASVVGLSVVFFRPLTISSFDPRFAVAVGLPVSLIHHALMAMLSVTAVASFEAVGAILVVALLLAPAATAHLLTERMAPMLWIALVHALLSATLGLYVAVWTDINPAGAMVVVGSALYLLAWLFAPGQRGLISRHLSRRQRTQRSRVAEAT